MRGQEVPAAEVDGLVRRFGAKVALAGVHLTLRQGEIHALLGPNGAGKTTLTRILCGLAEPHGGTVRTNGTIGLVPSGDRTFYLRISGAENLVFFARLQGLRLRPAQRRATEVLEKVGLSEAAQLPVGRYSHGMQKRLSVARALLTEPSVLLVDEATHDLDPEGASRIRSLIASLATRGTAVLWTTQRVEEIRGFADAVTFLHQGSVRFTGTVSELIALAPPQTFVVTVRNGDPNRSPEAAKLQAALGVTGRICAAPGAPGHFLMTPAPDRALGSAIAALMQGGYEVLGCRQERAEIEDAFLTLVQDSSS